MAGYGDDDGFTAWLAVNGYTLPASSPAPEVLRQRGSSYIDAVYGPRFTGYPTGGYQQERQWPRTNASAYGEPIPVDEIPTPVIESSYYAAAQEGLSTGSLSSSTSKSGLVKRERVEGAVEVEYFESSGDALYAGTPRFGYIEGLLAPFMLTHSAGYYGAVAIV
jgi:hypothetical protein